MFDEFLQSFQRLHAAERYFPIRDEGGHAAESQLLCLPLIREHVFEVQIVIERLSQVVACRAPYLTLSESAHRSCRYPRRVGRTREKARRYNPETCHGDVPSRRLDARGASGAVRVEV